MSDRHLDRCAVCSALGEDEADRQFGCRVPPDIDMDSTSGLIVMDGIARDKAKCERCTRDHRRQAS